MPGSENIHRNTPDGPPEPAYPQRLDVIAAQVAGVSRRRAQRLIADGVVTLNGRPAAAKDKGRMIGPTDAVSVSADVGRVVPQPETPLVELASGPGWVAVDKPAGMPVHPLREGETGTVLNALAARYPRVQGVGTAGGEGGLRSGVVHRLDTDTSGVLLIALNETRWRQFRAAFSEHHAKKIYAAVVSGEMTEDAGDADVPLAVTRHRPAYVEVVKQAHPEARRCRLSWRVTGRGPDATAIQVNLGTGFLHQIRATFRDLGHPVKGDAIYGEDSGLPSAPRLMLHATRLEIANEIVAVSPAPAEFGLPVL